MSNIKFSLSAREKAKRILKISLLVEDFENFILVGNEIDHLFKGATTLRQVINLMLNLALEEEPNIIILRPSNDTILPMLNLALRKIIIKYVDNGNLSQAEHLLCQLAHHLAIQSQTKRKEDVRDILTLYAHWQQVQTEIRNAKIQIF